MKNEQHKNSLKIITWLGILVILLLVVGFVMRSKLVSFLHIQAETQVEIQAGTLAESIHSNLRMKLSELVSIAQNLEEYESDMYAIMEFTDGEAGSGYEMGVLRLNGEAAYGEALDFQEFSGIQNAFRGNQSVCYCEGKGLLFTVPVYSGDNIKYVLYRLYEEEILVDEFGLSYYNNEGTVIVVDGNGIIIPARGWNTEMQEQFYGSHRQQAFSEIHEKMNIATAAAVYDENNGVEDFLFVSEIGDTDMYLVGVVPKAVYADGMNEITSLVLWVFGLLAVLFSTGLAYIFSAEEKVRESNKLRQEKEMAEHANRIKSEFLARMSHEIRTPINAVIGMNEMILRESSDEEICGYANNIDTASRNLLTLINDILDFSKIESGKSEIEESDYELGYIVRDAYNMIQLRAKQKNLEVKVQVEESLPYKLRGDGKHIKQILVNLLSNAVKYTAKGCVTLEVSGERIEENFVRLLFQVKDTGIGIREEDLEKLFVDFERLDLKRNHNIEGTGLGLAISYRLAMQMNGELTVSSEYGKGSVFALSLPQQIVETEAITNYRNKYQETQSTAPIYTQSFMAPQAKVLVVDDNDMNLLVVKNLLKKTEIQLTCCSSGEECLERVKQERFDVILLDHMMPGMDGIETLAQLQKTEDWEKQHISVIALTANVGEGVREQYLEVGFHDYMSKPIDANVLECILIKYLPKEKCNTDFVLHDTAEERINTVEVTGGKGKTETKENYLNPEIGLQYCGDSAEIYEEILQMFCDMKEEKKQALQESYENKDWNNYTIQIHALKSGSMSIGGKVLSLQAAQLEKAGKGQDEAYILREHDAVMDLYDCTVMEAKEYLKKINN